jgi:hypothetical protein
VVAALRVWTFRERHHDSVAGLVLHHTASPGEDRLVAHLEQRVLHASKLGRTWIREHNVQVKTSGKGVRILPLFLPTRSPWLNPIESKWVHGKRAVVEPKGLLTARQLAERICAYYHCSYEAHLSIPEKVS